LWPFTIINPPFRQPPSNNVAGLSSTIRFENIFANNFPDFLNGDGLEAFTVRAGGIAMVEGGQAGGAGEIRIKNVGIFA